MSVTFVGKVYDHFEKITDPRVNRGTNYPLVEMVFVALCGTICDCNSWVDVAEFGRAKLDWFRKFLPLERGIPSHDTFTEVFARLDTIEFYAALESAVQQALIEAFETDDPQLRSCQKQEQNRDRHETRQVTVRPVPKNSTVFARWPGVNTIGSIYRTREIRGVREEAQEFFITSLPCKVRAIAKHLRAHWSIENSLHHVLDVTFTEDASRIRHGNGPEITSVFRRLALQILQQDTTVKASIRGKRKICGWDEPAFEKLIAGFSAI